MTPEQQAVIVKTAVEWVNAQAATMSNEREPMEPILDRMDAACDALIRAVEGAT